MSGPEASDYDRRRTGTAFGEFMLGNCSCERTFLNRGTLRVHKLTGLCGEHAPTSSSCDRTAVSRGEGYAVHLPASCTVPQAPQGPQTPQAPPAPGCSPPDGNGGAKLTGRGVRPCIWTAALPWQGRVAGGGGGETPPRRSTAPGGGGERLPGPMLRKRLVEGHGLEGAPPSDHKPRSLPWRGLRPPCGGGQCGLMVPPDNWAAAAPRALMPAESGARGEGGWTFLGAREIGAEAAAGFSERGYPPSKMALCRSQGAAASRWRPPPPPRAAASWDPAILPLACRIARGCRGDRTPRPGPMPGDAGQTCCQTWATFS
mmetsp:Transcript_65715/g.140570  ORF Transcript_65715/g.140570 Transcript_65715/m.140570 type:complete len:316 (+) Transcript_65715:43-990(+)